MACPSHGRSGSVRRGVRRLGRGLRADAAERAHSPKSAAPTSIPYGWVDFCRRRPEECNLGKLTPRDIHLTKQVLATLAKVNAFANAAIEPISNLDHWGTMLDHWDYPTDGKGDCKIYALFKRKQLVDQRLPASGAVDDDRARLRTGRATPS